jgi:hypothetical protein
MPAIYDYAIAFSMFAYLVIIIIEFAKLRSLTLTVVQLLILAMIAGVLRVTTGFPILVILFGPASPVLILVVWLAVVAGTAAHYVFFEQGPFQLRASLKPIALSPMVVFPLLGTMQSDLAFQSGFFLKRVLKNVGKNPAPSRPGAERRSQTERPQSWRKELKYFPFS